MPRDTYKSGAVPFTNEKGERSMKRVKVERYVAGKRPAYAKEGDEDEEYYTTDEEMSGMEENEGEDEAAESSEEEPQPVGQESEPGTNAGKKSRLSNNDDVGEEESLIFKKCIQLDAKIKAVKCLDLQLSLLALRSDGPGRNELRNIVIDEDDEDEDEEDVSQRHAAARQRVLEEPLKLNPKLCDSADQQLEYRLHTDHYGQTSRRIDTEDLLKDLKLTGIKPKQKKEETKAEGKLKDLIENAKQEAILTAQLHKKIEEDNKKELEKEALSKGGLGSREMEAVKTDDEDDELAYEEWKLREIQRISRDKKERASLGVKLKC